MSKLVELTDEEYSQIIEERKRKEEIEKIQSSTITYTPELNECEHLCYDADGDYCLIKEGYGVNSHCWLRRGIYCEKQQKRK